jgi:hypothetical protein
VWTSGEEEAHRLTQGMGLAARSYHSIGMVRDSRSPAVVVMVSAVLGVLAIIGLFHPDLLPK